MNFVSILLLLAVWPTATSAYTNFKFGCYGWSYSYSNYTAVSTKDSCEKSCVGEANCTAYAYSNNNNCFRYTSNICNSFQINLINQTSQALACADLPEFCVFITFVNDDVKLPSYKSPSCFGYCTATMSGSLVQRSLGGCQQLCSDNSLCLSIGYSQAAAVCQLYAYDCCTSTSYYVNRSSLLVNETCLTYPEICVMTVYSKELNKPSYVIANSKIGYPVDSTSKPNIMPNDKFMTGCLGYCQSNSIQIAPKMSGVAVMEICENMCASLPTCMSFAYNNASLNCWLYNSTCCSEEGGNFVSLGSCQYSDCNTTVYLRAVRSSYTQSCYGSALSGSTSKDATVAACQSRCTSTSGCKSFSYSIATMNCTLYTADVCVQQVDSFQAGENKLQRCGSRLNSGGYVGCLADNLTSTRCQAEFCVSKVYSRDVSTPQFVDGCEGYCSDNRITVLQTVSDKACESLCIAYSCVSFSYLPYADSCILYDSNCCSLTSYVNVTVARATRCSYGCLGVVKVKMPNGPNGYQYRRICYGTGPNLLSTTTSASVHACHYECSKRNDCVSVSYQFNTLSCKLYGVNICESGLFSNSSTGIKICLTPDKPELCGIDTVYLKIGLYKNRTTSVATDVYPRNYSLSFPAASAYTNFKFGCYGWSYYYSNYTAISTKDSCEKSCAADATCAAYAYNGNNNCLGYTSNICNSVNLINQTAQALACTGLQETCVFITIVKEATKQTDGNLCLTANDCVGGRCEEVFNEISQIYEGRCCSKRNGETASGIANCCGRNPICMITIGQSGCVCGRAGSNGLADNSNCSTAAVCSGRRCDFKHPLVNNFYSELQKACCYKRRGEVCSNSNECCGDNICLPNSNICGSLKYGSDAMEYANSSVYTPAKEYCYGSEWLQGTDHKKVACCPLTHFKKCHGDCSCGKCDAQTDWMCPYCGPEGFCVVKKGDGVRCSANWECRGGFCNYYYCSSVAP